MGCCGSTTRSSSWSTAGSASVRPEHAAQFKPFAERIRQFYRIPQGAGAARHRGRPRPPAASGATTTPTASVRKALNKDLEMLGAMYSRQARETYAQDRRRHRFHRLADERARRAGGPARRGRRVDPAPRGGRVRSPRSRGSPRQVAEGEARAGAVRRAARRDRRAVALDQRVPARHASQQGAQPLDG